MSQKKSELTMARHWAMLQMLPNNARGISTAEIEEKLRNEGFPITRKSIQRDLDKLSSVFPITYEERGKAYYWFWMIGQRKVLPGYTVPEALSMQLIEDYMKQLLPKTILSVLEPNFIYARQKLESLKSENKNATWPDKVRVINPSLPQIAPDINPDVLIAVQNALIDDMQLKIEYSKPHTTNTAIWEIHPLGMVQRGIVTYLVCSMFSYSNKMLIALHRIIKADILDTPKNTPEGFSLDAFIEDGNLQFGGGEKIKFEAIISPFLSNYLRESPLSQDMKITVKDDIHKISATVVESWQFDWWIKSHGKDIEVLKPLSLREKIRDDLQATLENYQ